MQHRIHPQVRKRAAELRHPLTAAEQSLWVCLRDRRLGGFKFRRQHPIGRFIVDFYCAECRLVIEVDGDSHADQEAYDDARTEWLADRGYHVMRFTNREVEHRCQAVLEAIWEECDRRAAAGASAE